MVQKCIRNNNWYKCYETFEDLKKYISENDKVIWDAFQHVVDSQSYECLKYILKIAEKEGCNLKFTDSYIEDILIKFETEQASEILLLIMLYNLKSNNYRTFMQNLHINKIIQIGNANKIEHNQISNKSNNWEDAYEEEI